MQTLVESRDLQFVASRPHASNGPGETTSILENGVTTTFSWNNDGRITGMDLPGTTNDPTFRYNGFGTRIDRTVGANTEVWKRAGAGVTATVLNDGTADFTPGISSRVGSTSTFNHAGLKNTTAQSEGLAITGTKTYDAFGLEASATGTWKTAFGYAGNFGYQETDAGMKLLGHRCYDPETGRFLSRDPIKDGRNWYAYGAGQTAMIGFADPSGLVRIIIVWRPLEHGNTGAHHADMIIIDNVPGSATYGQSWIVAGGPQFQEDYAGYGFCLGSVGELKREERNRRIEAGAGAVVLVDDQTPVGGWLDSARGNVGRMNDERVLYNPLDFSKWDTIPDANSNGYLGELIERMGLADELGKAIDKRGGMPWSPGWTGWPFWR